MAITHALTPDDRPDDHAAVTDATTLATLLDVLGDPTRLAIIRHLHGGEHRVGELTEHLGLAQSTVSQHLAILRSAGLVSAHSHGRATVNQLEHTTAIDAVLEAAARLADATHGIGGATAPDGNNALRTTHGTKAPR